MACPVLFRALLATVVMVVPFVAASPAAGQPQSGALVGMVTSLPSREPLPGALIEIVGTNRRATTDSAGVYRMRGLPGGEFLVEARAIGYQAMSVTVAIVADTTVRLDLEFRPVVVELPGITANDAALAAREARLQGFNQRRTSGFGRFFTREQIEKRNLRDSRDLLRLVPGVRVVGDRVQMASSSSRRCVVQFFVDGLHVAAATLDILRQFQPRDLEGMEIYRGPAETPAAFSRGGAECGVIAIWTRVGRRPEA